MEPLDFSSRIVSVEKLQDKEKLPKSIILHNVQEERNNGLNSFTCAAYCSSYGGNTKSLHINGEYSGKMSRDVIILILIYNANDELIEANFSEKIEKSFKGKRTFSQLMIVPCDEFISRISFKIISNPVYY